ncbi:methionine gamma-lyase family protein [Bacillus norwichensis]|uniref:Methionine gamma-lyase family protein n=1 Tax=Bacillus norwichensis TaxID=2762217 RepID=A0ABR8VN75_9BACI|nr:methionine gamma-lyase family protein [Bacillus norwichensis]MBD8006215.1 methionine gamma-lyase family protein [Bacillus norwichensis]
MYNYLQHEKTLRPFIEQAEEKVADIHRRIDRIIEENQYKVLRSFQEHQVGEFHFTPSTGYGYNDLGRETLEKIYADVFGGESALVRQQIVSGTHAISIALFGVLRPGDELLYITGKPYDTLEEVVGIRGNGSGSLKEFGINYNAVPLKENGKVDFEAVSQAMKPNTKVIGIQRSKGYDDRPSFTIKEIEEMIRFVKEIDPKVIVFVDNCYGEFVETLEPCNVGADLMAGSLIKNPGGGLVKSGGYIIGKEELVEACSYRMTSPGLGVESGASLYTLLEMYQGFFLAPHVTGQAVKGAVFTSALLELIGLQTTPKWDDFRTDLIQAVQFSNADMMIEFCQAIQAASPVDSHVTPFPSEMPGYNDQVIMAAGAFIQGASIELSADGPIRPPYSAYVQGGLTYAHVKIAIASAVDRLIEKGLIKLN